MTAGKTVAGRSHALPVLTTTKGVIMIFSQFIARFKAARMDEALTEEMKALNIAAQHFGKPAELNIKIKYTPGRQGDMKVDMKYTTKMPKADSMEAVMYTTPEGNLIENDPKQEQLFSKVEVLESGKPNKVVNL